MVDLSVDLGFITLKNPIIPASGTFGYGEEFLPFIDLDSLGAITLKGIFKNPRQGNPPPRIYETPAGLLNSIGLAGPGAETLKRTIEKLGTLTTTPVIVNICGDSDEEYLEVAQIFDPIENVKIMELNISCPNVETGGRCPAQDEDHTFRLVKLVKDNTTTPLMVKLSPNVPNIAPVALAAEAAGADCLSLVNTFLGLAVDLQNRKPVFHNVVAGLSGPAIKPLALKLVWEVVQTVAVPVVGIGGITSGRDVLEYILVGAAAVQTGTINMIEPSASRRILREVREEMKKMQVHNLKEFRGTLKT